MHDACTNRSGRVAVYCYERFLPGHEQLMPVVGRELVYRHRSARHADQRRRLDAGADILRRGDRERKPVQIAATGSANFDLVARVAVAPDRLDTAALAHLDHAMLPHFAPLEAVALLVRLVQDIEVPIPVDDRLRRVKREVRIAAVNRRIGQHALPPCDQQVARNAAMHVRQRHVPAVGILAQVLQPGWQFDVDLAFVDDADHGPDRGREDVWKLRASHICAVHGPPAVSHGPEPARLGQAQDAAALDRRLAVIGIPAQNPLVKPLGGVGWMAGIDWH